LRQLARAVWRWLVTGWAVVLGGSFALDCVYGILRGDPVRILISSSMALLMAYLVWYREVQR